jgi:hypothetical protein
MGENIEVHHSVVLPTEILTGWVKAARMGLGYKEMKAEINELARKMLEKARK